jgi:outer membrane protein assembly factor BamE (lipoprotein component of BamABCDE complex)
MVIYEPVQNNSKGISLKEKLIYWLILAVAGLTGCTSVGDHRQAVKDSSEQKLTLGVAQRQINVGMSQADVATALGSPNMVTKDKDGVETWIYDKFSTEFAYSTSSGGITGLVLGPSGAGVGGVSQAGGASSRTQRTLTIVIKFQNAQVKEFTYNATSF